MSTRADAVPIPAHAPDSDRVRLTTGQAIVKYLQVQYSERDGSTTRLIPAMFGILGHGNAAGLGQALVEHGGDLPFYQPFNEQSMVHCAAAYAKACGRRATLACAASIGPGSTNMVTGAAAATVNSLPVLLLPADYYASRRQGVVLQQIDASSSADASVNDCFRPVSRFFDRITRADQLLDSLPRAMAVLTDPADTGAVTIALPQDVQSEAYDYPSHFFNARVWHIERRPPAAETIALVVDLLATAKRPFIIAGGGVHYSEASAELATFAETCGIPVGETFAGRGAMAEASTLTLGGVGVCGTPAAASLARDADLVICVGTRLADFTTGSMSLFQNPAVRFVSVNTSTSDAHKLAALPVVADAREALRELTAGAQARGLHPDPAYAAEILRLGSDWREQRALEVSRLAPEGTLRQVQVVGILNHLAHEDDVIVAAAGSPPADVQQLWDATGRRHVHLEFGFSCMGYEIPGGIGVRMAGAAGEVFVLIGDGTYLMNPGELVTAVRERWKVTVLLMDNHGYQAISRLQRETVGQTLGTEFEGPRVDFCRNAESLGARSWHVETEAELRRAIGEARLHDGVAVIHVEIAESEFGPPSGVWWDVAPAESSDDPLVRDRRAAYERGRVSQRYYGTTS